jgi:hypothetical protein
VITPDDIRQIWQQWLALQGQQQATAATSPQKHLDPVQTDPLASASWAALAQKVGQQQAALAVQQAQQQGAPTPPAALDPGWEKLAQEMRNTKRGH